MENYFIYACLIAVVQIKHCDNTDGLEIREDIVLAYIVFLKYLQPL